MDYNMNCFLYKGNLTQHKEGRNPITQEVYTMGIIQLGDYYTQTRLRLSLKDVFRCKHKAE